MHDFALQFHQEMKARGFEPRGGKVIADGKWHQAAHDGERHKFSGTYILNIHTNGTFANGVFFTRKDPDNKYKWHSEPDKSRPADPEGLKRQREMIERQHNEKEAAEAKRQNRLSHLLSNAVIGGMAKASNDHPYLKRKGVKAHGIRLRAKGNELVLPLRDVTGKIWTIQRITEGGGKYLWTGAKKKGTFFLFDGAVNGIILLCEGYATGATLFEATGYTVAACIDSGNIKEVARALKQDQELPDVKIVICADNDAFTMKPDKVTPWNVGIEAAQKAAAEIGGAFVVWPSFQALAEGFYKANKPTDFNDLQNCISLDEVKKQIMAVVDGIPAKQDEAAPAAETLVSDQHSGGGDYSPPDIYEDEPQHQLRGDFDMNFKVLGYNEGNYYYFPFKERQIVCLSASGHTLNNLFRLDSLDAWMRKFGSAETSEKRVVMYATNALMDLAKKRGVFKEEDSIRGCGAWIDEGRKILHCGDAIYVDGKKTPFDEINSDFTYVASKKVFHPSSNVLSDKEAYALREICEAVTWENKLSGSLLAGWLVIAPVCGALSYRPHVFVYGEHESGKSTVTDRIVKPVIGKIAVCLDGRSTEPKIREYIGYGSRPVAFDEAEKSENFGAVLDLVRSSSDGKIVGKFGQKIFKAMSAFYLCAINPPVSKAADESRMAFMRIKKNRKPTAIDDYNALIAKINDTIKDDFSNRMIARTMLHFDTLMKNIDTFQAAARVIIKGARASQVIGTMLAGLYLLSKTDVVTQKFAEEWIARHDWSSYMLSDTEADPSRLVGYLSNCIIKYTNMGKTEDMSIGDLIYLAARENDKRADKILRLHGMAVKDGRVYIASRCQHLERLLKETDWNIKWIGMLENIEGSEKFKTFYFGVGFKTNGVSLPVKAFITDEQPKLIEPPQDAQEIKF